jgi:hypothetical protein
MSVLAFRIPEPQPVTEDRTRGSEVEVSYLNATAIAGQLSVIPRAPAVELLGSVRDHRLRVLEPFAITFRTEESQFVAEATEIDEFGFGHTQSEALEDLQGAIVELYASLARDEHRLGADLRRVWAVLRQKIQLVSGHEGLGV